MVGRMRIDSLAGTFMMPLVRNITCTRTLGCQSDYP